MQIQPQLILLQKTLLNIEGLGRELYPELDLWNTAQPILREWMRERSGVRAFVRSLRTEAPQLLAGMRELPAALQRLLRAPVVPVTAPGAPELDVLRAEMRDARGPPAGARARHAAARGVRRARAHARRRLAGLDPARRRSRESVLRAVALK